MPAYQEIPRPGRPKGTDQENILQMYRYQHTLAELLEAAINTIGNAGDRNIEETAKVEKVQREEKERVTQLKSVTRELNTTIQQTNVELNLKAPQKDVDSLKTQVSDATGKIASLEFSLNDLEVRAVLKAEYETDKNAMLTLISNAEESIATLEASHNGRIAALELYTSGLESRVVLLAEYEKNRYADLQLISNAEESIAALEASHDGRIAALEVTATEQGTLIAAKADLILLDGYVKMEDFEAVQGWATDFAGVTVSASYVVAGTGDFDELSCGQFWCGSLSVDGGEVATQEWVEEQGFLKIGSGATGNLATQSWVIEQNYTTALDVSQTLDGYVMKGELDDYATQAWVKEQGYLTKIPNTYATQSWVIERNYTTASDVAQTLDGYVMQGELDGYATEAWVRENFSKASATYKPTVIERYGSVSGNSIPVQALNESGEVLLTATVDAGDVYDSGYSSGNRDGFNSGYNSGYTAGQASIDTGAYYDEGYEIGYAAGFKAAKEAVKVTAGISWSNPAQYYAMVRYWGRATINGEEVGYAASSESKNISGYV